MWFSSWEQILNNVRSVLLLCSHAWDTASAKDQFYPLNSLLAMHNCRWKVKYNIADNFSCVSARSIKTFFFLFLSEEQLEEDKLHSNGGKVLSSELKNAHSGCSPQILCLWISLCEVFSGTLLVLWLMQLCSVLLAFFSSSHTHSIHLCLICATSAYLNTTALLICSRQITAKFIFHYPNWAHFLVINVCLLPTLFLLSQSRSRANGCFSIKCMTQPVSFKLVHHITSKYSPRLWKKTFSQLIHYDIYLQIVLLIIAQRLRHLPLRFPQQLVSVQKRKVKLDNYNGASHRSLLRHIKIFNVRLSKKLIRLIF